MAPRHFSFTFLARSVSPQGSLRVNSIPVRGVSVGGSNMDASIISKGSFTWNDCVCGGEGDGGGVEGDGGGRMVEGWRGSS